MRRGEKGENQGSATLTDLPQNNSQMAEGLMSVCLHLRKDAHILEKMSCQETDWLHSFVPIKNIETASPNYYSD